jgi:hypothetical protein
MEESENDAYFLVLVRLYMTTSSRMDLLEAKEQGELVLLELAWMLRLSRRDQRSLPVSNDWALGNARDDERTLQRWR